MKALRIILILVYLLLIGALLLLSKCQKPEYDDEEEDEEEEEDIRRADEWGDGKLKVTLLWDFYGDLDLHVTEPSGFELGWIEDEEDGGHLESESPSGGTLDHDDREGGPEAGENIFWENPPRGEYKIEVVYFSKRDEGPENPQVKVIVQKEGSRPKTFKVRLQAPEESEFGNTVRPRTFVTKVKVR